MLYSHKKMNILIICLYLYSKPIKNWKIESNNKTNKEKINNKKKIFSLEFSNILQKQKIESEKITNLKWNNDDNSKSLDLSVIWKYEFKKI